MLPNINPTEGQKRSGNYKKGKVKINGLDISIEQPRGSVREGTDANGKQWSQEMHNTYGYIHGTQSRDGDNIDVFLNDEGFNDDAPVFVIDQTNEDGSFDEHKVMLGFNSAEEAMAAYLSNYEQGWEQSHPGIRMSETSMDKFKEWIGSSNRKMKPFAEYRENQTSPAVNNTAFLEGFPTDTLEGMLSTNERELRRRPADWSGRAAMENLVSSIRQEITRRNSESNLPEAPRQRNQIGRRVPGNVDVTSRDVVRLAEGFGRKVSFEGNFFDEQHGGYVDADGVIHINPNMSVDMQMAAVIGHELTHTVEGSKAYDRLVDFLNNNETFKNWLAKQGYESLEEMVKSEVAYRREFRERKEAEAQEQNRELTEEERDELDSLDLTEEEAQREIVADFCGEMVFGNRRFLQDMLKNVKESRGIIQRIIDAIRNLIHRMTNRGSEMSAETVQDLHTISDMLTDALREVRDRENHAESRSRNNVTTYWNQHYTDKKNVSHSGREMLEQTMRNNGASEKEIKRVLRQMDHFAKLAETLGEGYPQFQYWQESEPVVGDDGVIHLTCVVKNAEYPMNIDFSIICKKKEAATELLDYLMHEGDPSIVKDGKILLNRDNLRTINNIVKQHGFEMACDLCFVEAKRFGMSTWANSFVDFWNPLVKVAMTAKLKAEGKLPADFDAESFSMGEFNFRGSNEADMASDEADVVTDEVRVAMFKAMTQYIAQHPEEMRTKVEPMYDLVKDENGNWVRDESRIFTKRHPLDEDGKEIKGEWEKIYLRKKADGSGFEETGETAPMPKKPAMKEYTKLKGKGTLYADKPIVSKMVELISSPTLGGRARKMLNAADLVSPSGMDGLIHKFNALYKIVNIHGGVSKPKSQHGHSPYVSAALTGSSGVSFSKEKAFHIGGVRNQSFSDYEAMLWFDYMQLYADMSALGMPMQVYTKEPAYARLFGMMGSKVNLSLLCQTHKPTEELARVLFKKNTLSPIQEKVLAYLQDHAGLRPVSGTALEAFSAMKAIEKELMAMKPKGAVTESMAALARLIDRINENDNLEEWEYNWGDQTFPAREAFDIIADPNYTANVGTILVAVGDKMMRKALADPRIKMVIPYHKSGIPKDVALSSGVFLYKDYSKWQTDRKIDKDGKAKEPKINFYDCIKVVESRLRGEAVEGVKSFESKSRNAYHDPATYSANVQSVLDMIMPEGHSYTVDDVPMLAGKLFALNAVLNDNIMPRFADYVFEHEDGGISINKKAAKPHLQGIVTDENSIPKFSEQAETYFKKVEDFNMIATEAEMDADGNPKLDEAGQPIVHYKYHPQGAVRFNVPERVKVRGEGWTSIAVPTIGEETKINVVRDGKLIEMPITDMIDADGYMSINDFIAAHVSRWESTRGKLRTSMADMASDAYRLKALENEIVSENEVWAVRKLDDSHNELTATLSRWSGQGYLNFSDAESIARAKEAINLAIRNDVSLDNIASPEETIAKFSREASLGKRKRRNYIGKKRGGRNAKEIFEAARDLVASTGIPVHEVSNEQAENMAALADHLHKKTSQATGKANSESAEVPAVTCDDAANVAKKIESLIEKYKNLNGRHQTRNFISDLSTIIGIPERGQSSRYVDIESVNGTKFTLRLSNHNAKVSNFDSCGEKEGISIVISRQANYRMTNDGDAHVVENFYPDKKLQNTEDALVKILQSVQQMFYSGKYKDTTGLAEQEEVNIPDFHRTFHGTAANFEAFDFSHMGEGEGAQFYGWGGYVTDVEGVGRKYAESASPTPLDYPMAIRSAETSLHLHQKMSESIEAKVRRLKDELEDLEIEAEDRKMEGFKTQTERELYDDLNRQIQEIKEKINFFESEESQQRQLAVESEGRLADLHKEYDKWLETKNSRHLYTVEIPDDNGANYLDYTKGLNKEQATKLNQVVLNKLSKEQQDILSERLQGLAMLNEPTNGRNVYDTLRSVLGSPKAASEFLSEAGFTGIKYPTDYLAGGNTEGHSNFVIFNDADMRIIDHVTFLRSSDGIIYGWTVNGEIYLNMDAMNPETPIHEYTHMWDSMIQLSNPKLWAQGKALLQTLPLWNEIRNSVAYRHIQDNDDAIASEVHSRLTGARGVNLLSEMASKNKKASSIIEKVKEWIAAVYKELKTTFSKWSRTDLENLSVEEFSNLTLRDLSNGLNPKNGHKTIVESELSQSDDDIRFRMVEDKAKLAELENLSEDELVHVYRNVQVFPDGSLGSPMAAYNPLTGERSVVTPQTWNESEERDIQLTEEQAQQLEALKAAPMRYKTGKDGKRRAVEQTMPVAKGLRFLKTSDGAKLQFYLQRDGEALWADYNPYDHSIAVPLNDQFKAAHRRPNLVVVEAVIPKSELDHPYQAPYARNAVGAVEWNNGRTLYLSRWSKILRILPRSEEAELIDKYWRENPERYTGAKVTDYDRFTPQVRAELEKRGYKFKDKKGNRKDWDSMTEEERLEAADGMPYVDDAMIAELNKRISSDRWVSEPKYREGTEEQSHPTESLSDAAMEMGQTLGVEVEVIEDTSNMTGRQRRAKGWFDPKTGKVVVIPGNHANVADIRATILHEIVGHKGLQAVVGEKRFFNNIA